MLVASMFLSVWGGVLGAFTMSFEDAMDRQIIDICLKGFETCTHIGSHCYVEEALRTVVDSFAKFTRLRNGGDICEKNFLCTDALISCAVQDRNHLKGAWSIVLGEISALDRLKDNGAFLCDMRASEALFEQTHSLDRESILDFAKAMCSISRQEVSEKPPRTYMLLKFSDVAYWNMSRPMFIWKDIWNIIGAYLSETGCSTDLKVAVSTVDIIRQLARQFLQKEEMMEYHFQKHFLNPFFVIYERRPLRKIREHIIECVDYLALELADVLRSGWDVFLPILRTTSVADDIDLKVKAFGVIEKIILHILHSVKPYLMHLIDVLASFINNDSVDVVAQQGVAYFSLIGDIIRPDEPEIWIFLLQSAGSCVQHKIMGVRKCAEEILISIITGHGCMSRELDSAVWRFFLKTTLVDLFPNRVMDAAETAHVLKVLRTCFVHLLLKFPDVVQEFVDDIIGFLGHCCSSVSDGIRDASIGYFGDFVKAHESTILRNTELTNLLLTTMRSLLNRMIDSISFVNFLGQLLIASDGNEEAVTALIDIVSSMIDACDRDGSVVVQGCWCAARFLLFQTYVRLGHIADYCGNLHETICGFLKHSEVEWSELVRQSLDLMLALDSKGFSRCCGRSLGLICGLICSEDGEVRKHVIPVLARRLDDEER
jgi:hypothetical protein